MVISILMFLGFVIATLLLLLALFTWKKKYLKYTGLFILIISLLGVFSFTIDFFKNRNREVLLTAFREAPLGGVLLTLYSDSTFELSNLMTYETSGKFAITEDTLFISTNGSYKLLKNFTETTFLITEKNLVEINNTGIGRLEINNKN